MTRLRIALALATCSWFVMGCLASTPRRPETVADSVRDFSGRQGANGWSYGYWDRTADADKNYDPVKDFQLLRHFGDDPFNGVSRHSDFTTGKLWNLQDGLYYTALWAEGGSANGTSEGARQAKVEQWAVRRWISTVKGPVTISGSTARILRWGDAESGQAKIVVDGATVFSAATHERDAPYSVSASVHVGSRVDFLITAGSPESGGSLGPIKFTATLQGSR